MHRHRRSQLAIVLTLVAATSACLGPLCTTELVPSVVVTVVDDDGTPVADADVVFSVDGSEVEDCTVHGEGEYTCGAELGGEFVITATKTGYADADGTVTVADRDGACHVAGETLTLRLLAEGPALPE